MPIPWLHPTHCHFPPTHEALEEPNGLLAVGGDLSPNRLLAAYRQGIFPWYEANQPILWWTPSPRTVVFPHNLKISKSLKKTLRQKQLQVVVDQQFDAVIKACAAPRAKSSGTWITREIQAAYSQLYRMGYAHSVETYLDGTLVGGLYGISLGKIFFGESMFSRVDDASKIAFVHLVQRLGNFGFTLIDCQVYSDHLASLGAEEIEREDFEAMLNQNVSKFSYVQASPWDGDWNQDL